MLQCTMVNLYICNSSNPGGEIGRRTSLRGWRLYGCGSSNLLLGTLKQVTPCKSLTYRGFVF